MTPKEEADWLHANPPPVHRFISIDKWAEYGFTLPPLRTLQEIKDDAERMPLSAEERAKERDKKRKRAAIAKLDPEERKRMYREYSRVKYAKRKAKSAPHP